MFHFLCKTVILGRRTIAAAPTQSDRLLSFLQSTPLLFSLRFISTFSNELSFTASYLISKFGFSPESASAASKYVQFETPDKPDSVISFFQSQGFSETQIAKIVRRLPPLLLCDAEKTLLPKFEFFQSKGFSRPQIATILTGFPFVLKRSLVKQLIPNFDFCFNLLQCNEKVMDCIRRYTGVLTTDLELYVVPNINFLKNIGVPESNIRTVFHYQPRTFVLSHDHFKEVVKKVQNMGFDPLRLKFALAVFGLRAISPSTWERKLDAYRKCGWSEEETLQAFLKHPWCMMASENKIIKVMDFLIKKMGIHSSLVAKRPVIITMSLEKRTVPRGMFLQVLLSKGLIKDFKLYAFEVSEKSFLDRYVYCFEEQAAELLKIYEEKMGKKA